jgi:hypothetical protein
VPVCFHIGVRRPTLSEGEMKGVFVSQSAMLFRTRTQCTWQLQLIQVMGDTTSRPGRLDIIFLNFAARRHSIPSGTTSNLSRNSLTNKRLRLENSYVKVFLCQNRGHYLRRTIRLSLEIPSTL